MTSTKSKLQSHYQKLGSCVVDTSFDINWKQEVDDKASDYLNSDRCKDDVLDRDNIELRLGLSGSC